MKIASVSQTKNQLSALLEQVRQGEVLVITDHDRPVARITAITAEIEGGPSQGWAARLERKGLVRRGRGLRCDLAPPQPLRTGASAVDALIDERALGR